MSASVLSDGSVTNSICKLLLPCDELVLCSFGLSVCALLMHERRILMKRKEVVIRERQASTDGVGRWGTSDS
jgi:hypothetical protein